MDVVSDHNPNLDPDPVRYPDRESNLDTVWVTNLHLDPELNGLRHIHGFVFGHSIRDHHSD